MATTVPTLFLALAAAALLAASPASTTPPAAPAPAQDCITTIALDMSTCLGFVGTNSTDRAPPADCCKGLATVLKDSPICICQLAANQSSSSGEAAQFGVDPKRAMLLPKACKTSIPVDQCKKLGVPVSGTIGAAAAAPASAPTAGGPVAGAGGARSTAPAPTSHAATSSAWALLIAAGLPALALAGASIRV